MVLKTATRSGWQDDDKSTSLVDNVCSLSHYLAERKQECETGEENGSATGEWEGVVNEETT